jgi:hypothetical protein
MYGRAARRIKLPDLALVWMKKDRERRQMAVYWSAAEKAKGKFRVRYFPSDQTSAASRNEDVRDKTGRGEDRMPHQRLALLLANLDTLLPELEAIYKDIHAHPELSMQETRTARIAETHLKTIGFEVTAGVGKTGVVGLLRNGDGPTVMLRADMDALPIEEATGLPYASKVVGTTLRARLYRSRILAVTTCMWPV